MFSKSKCTLCNNLKIVPGVRRDLDALSRFHYCSDHPGPIRHIYKWIDVFGKRCHSASVIGVIVYGSVSANLAARNRALAGMFAGLDRSSALSLLNTRLLCIRRVIIEPRYRGLGLATRLVRETLERTGSARVEAVSVMGRAHPFLQKAGMREFPVPPDARSERMAAALVAVGIEQSARYDSQTVHRMIEQLDTPKRAFVNDEMTRFCQKFTNRRSMGHCPDRTDFVLSKLSHRPAYYLWTNPKNPEDGDFILSQES